MTRPRTTLDETSRTAKIRIWDPLIRCVHWSLLAAFIFAYLTRSDNYEPHLVTGYAVAGLVLLRIVWGFAGTGHARFSDFICGPRRVGAYLRDVLRRAAPRYLGHSPAGGAMTIALLTMLAFISLSGVALDAAENRAGPLGNTDLFLHRDRIALLHIVTTNTTLVLLAVHVIGVAATSLVHGENLTLSMITGKKRPNQERFDG